MSPRPKLTTSKSGNDTAVVPRFGSREYDSQLSIMISLHTKGCWRSKIQEARQVVTGESLATPKA